MNIIDFLNEQIENCLYILPNGDFVNIFELIDYIGAKTHNGKFTSVDMTKANKYIAEHADIEKLLEKVKELI